MFTLSQSSLPMLIAVVVLFLALYYKRATLRTRELLAFALVAAVVFFLLTGAFHALHFPHVALHLF